MKRHCSEKPTFTVSIGTLVQEFEACVALRVDTSTTTSSPVQLLTKLTQNSTLKSRQEEICIHFQALKQFTQSLQSYTRCLASNKNILSHKKPRKITLSKTNAIIGTIIWYYTDIGAIRQRILNNYNKYVKGWSGKDGHHARSAENWIRKTQTLRKNQMEMIEMKNTVTERNKSFNGLISNFNTDKERISELEHHSIEITQIETQKEKLEIKKK